MMSLVNLDPNTLIRLSNPNPNLKLKGWQKLAAAVKAEYGKAEPVILPSGNKEEKRLNSETHANIILRRETINQLIAYAKKDEYVFLTVSFDDIIQALLRRNQRRQSKD